MLHTSRRGSPRDRTRDDLFELVRDGVATTRSQLADLTGMSRSTVNHAVGRLLSEGRIVETEAEEKGPGSGSGRPAARLAVLPTGEPLGAIAFGHNHVHVAVGDSTGAIIDDERVELDVDLDAVEAIRCASDILSTLQQRQGITHVSSVVAGVPGPIDTTSRLVRSPATMSSWVGRDPAQDIADVLGVDVHVENDASLGALGELYRGSGRHHRDFLYVKASHGVGAAMVLDGQLYSGATGLAGEVGHTLLRGHSELCRCGNRGCLESVVSIGALHDQFLHTHPTSDPEIFDLDDTTDPITARIVNEAGRLLGGVLATLCNLLNPSALIIGGDLGRSTAFLDGVEAEVRRFAQPATGAMLDIVPAELSRQAEVVGALQLASARALR